MGSPERTRLLVVQFDDALSNKVSLVVPEINGSSSCAPVVYTKEGQRLEMPVVGLWSPAPNTPFPIGSSGEFIHLASVQNHD